MKTYTKANKLNFISMLALLWLGSFGVFGQVAQQPDWKWQNPLPTVNSLKGVHFVDLQNGWAVGDLGVIVRTSNGGSTWIKQSSGTTSYFRSVYFTNSQTGWAVGNNGTILKTSNGGSSWISQTSGTGRYLLSVNFIDAQNGWVVGDNGTILKTTNGGNSWLFQPSGTQNHLNSVHFTDPQNGWAVGDGGIILKTSNSGTSWISQSSGIIFLLSSVHFLDSQNGWTAGQFGILKTSNGGSTWQTCWLSQIGGTGTSVILNSVHFSDIQNGWAVGYLGLILKTTNGGISWLTQISSGTSNYLSSVHFTNNQIGWAVGLNGTILKTSDGGSNWISQVKVNTNHLQSVHFTNTQNGFAVGGNGTILKTSNGGRNWINKNSGTTNGLYGVHFIDSYNGWAVGETGIILKTTNGGFSWQNQASVTTNLLYAVHFSDDQNGCAVGNNGTILKTSNGGSSWIIRSSGTTNNLYSIHFINAQTGWSVGYGGRILKTNNGGNSWSTPTIVTTNDLYSVYFIDAENGWAVGKWGHMMKTVNGGISWNGINTGTSELLRSIYFSDALNGWAVGTGSTILKTSNGGSNWVSQSIETINQLNSVYFSDAIHGWAVGYNGLIISTSNLISPETPSTLITGNLFEKGTANCNPSPIPVPNRLVKAEPGPYYGIANNQGNYNLRLPLSDTATPFTLQALDNSNPAFNIQVVCPPNNQYNITLDTIPDTLSGKDFGFEITPCHHLDVQLASNRRRRCFQNTTSISYQNQGSLSAPDSYLLVEFPHWVRPVSASRSHVALNDSVWRFNLDTVSAGESGSFTITDSVICGNLGILGLSQCTKATIFPAPDCPPPPGYNGAEVTVSGKCNNGFVSLGIYNKGNADMTDSVDYWVYLDSIQVKQAKVKLMAGDSLKLSVEALGMSVHLTANQVANHPSEVFVSTTVENCSDTTVFYPRPMVNRFPKQQTANSKIHCLEIRGSYDPNDKQAFPIGFTNQNIIAPNTQLEYLVRFQNTGNDTAFTVYVIDTLDQNLNVESFEMGAASHTYQLSMQTVKSGKTFLRWQFNNIQLPDSNTNEPASNGFVQFRISPKAGLALGSKIRNHAEIYFDFNPPIITNQTLSTYDLIVYRDSTLNNNVQVVTSLPGKLSPQQIGVNLYPNPVTDHSLTADFQTKGSLTLFNAQGQLVFEKQNIEGKQVLPIQLKTGFYMAQLRTEKGVSVVKVVVE